MVEDEVEIDEILNDDVVLRIGLPQFFGFAITSGGNQESAGVLEGFQRRNDQLARILVVNGALRDEDHTLVFVELFRVGKVARDRCFVWEQRTNKFYNSCYLPVYLLPIALSTRILRAD